MVLPVVTWHRSNAFTTWLSPNSSARHASWWMKVKNRLKTTRRLLLPSLNCRGGPPWPPVSTVAMVESMATMFSSQAIENNGVVVSAPLDHSKQRILIVDDEKG